MILNFKERHAQYMTTCAVMYVACITYTGTEYTHVLMHKHTYVHTHVQWLHIVHTCTRVQFLQVSIPTHVQWLHNVHTHVQFLHVSIHIYTQVCVYIYMYSGYIMYSSYMSL